MLMATPLAASAPVKVGPVELRALVGVEYLRLAVARQGVLQRLDAAPFKSGRQSWNPLPLLVSGGRYLSTSLALSMPA